jgi:DNA helicase TIP49 (TBP-interacting protein)
MRLSFVVRIHGKYWTQTMMKKKLDEAVRRRVRAGRMLLAGKTPAQTALAVGVARQTGACLNFCVQGAA